MTAHRRIPDRLPSPVATPLVPAALESAVGRRRAALLRHALPDAPLLAAMASTTAIDTGSWFGKRRVGLAFTATTLYFVAIGPRPLCVAVPLADLRQTQYNTVTGELVFAPAAPPLRAAALPPLQATRALAQIAAAGLDGGAATSGTGILPVGGGSSAPASLAAHFAPLPLTPHPSHKPSS